MGNKKNNSNIIALYGLGVDDESGSDMAESEQATRFIVDMLDSLMCIATRNDRSVLVYLLAMARIEAMESSPSEDRSGPEAS